MPRETQWDRPTLLVAGLEPPAGPVAGAFACSAAHDAREVLHKLRAARVDLLLLGLMLRETPFASLMRRVRLAHPHQRWALVAPEIDPDAEIDARALGTLAIFDGPPSPSHLREMLDRVRPAAPRLPPVSMVRIYRPRPPGD